ncbi:hypothetical protein GF314_17160 [bacterium]|nr:hypothetical protein [bacterium]
MQIVRGLALNLVGVVCAIVLASCTVDQQPPPDHHQALRRLAAQLDADQFEAARRDLRDYLAQTPDDARMHYNLACLEARAGDREAALDELRLALRHGYRRLDRARADVDLASLRSGDDLERLLSAHVDSMARVARESAIHLIGDAWSDATALGPGTRLRVRQTADALQLEVTDLPAVARAWVVVAVPVDHDAWETPRWFAFALTTGDNGLAVAPATASVSGEVVTIPWSALTPHRPPLDLLLGLNVVVVDDGGRHALVDDPWVGRPEGAWRRYAPLHMDPGDNPFAVLAARPDTRLAIGDSLSLELGLQGVSDGEATVTVTAERAAPLDVGVPVDLGLGYATALVHFDDPPTGWVDLAAHTDAHDLVWRDRVFRLRPGWFLGRVERLADIPEAEQHIVRYWMFRVLRGQQTFDPRDDPAPLAAAVVRTDSLLARFDRTGSVLPGGASAVPVAVWAGQDALMAARLVLPAVEARTDAHAARLVLVDDEETMASAADSMLAAAAWPALVLTLPPDPGADEATARKALTARRWLGDLLPAVDAVALVGAGRAATSAVLAAAADPAAWSSLSLWAGAHLDPWPLAGTDAIAARVPAPLASLTTVTVLPPDAGRRAEAVAAALGSELVRRAPGDDVAIWLARERDRLD